MTPQATRQILGESVRALGGAGVVYNSVRQAGGVTVVAHRPRNVINVMQAEHFRVRVETTSRRVEVIRL